MGGRKFDYRLRQNIFSKRQARLWCQYRLTRSGQKGFPGAFFGGGMQTKTYKVEVTNELSSADTHDIHSEH